MARKVEATNNVEPADEDAGAAALPSEQVDALDADEAEFRALRRDLSGVKGASATGIVAMSVGKTPAKNEFFRTHREFGRSYRSLIWKSAWSDSSSR